MTFLFTDIEESTRLWEEAPTDMAEALRVHDAIVRDTIERHGGYVFGTGGDGFFAAFSTAADAAAAAIESQEQLRANTARSSSRCAWASNGLDTLTTADAALIGTSQIGALFAGISRSGVTIVTGLLRGLDHEDAARFSFLLATPVIFAAGVYKLPDLAGPLGDGIRGQVIIGSLCAGAAAYVAVRFLTRWFHTRTLTPFAIYCLVAGVVSIVHFA